MAAREGVESDIRVNVEFHVPGTIWTPEFEGVRTGFFRRADSLLKVQVALPAEAPAVVRPHLVGYLSDAP